ncbi:polyhydroxybutyrate depolymerase [Micromonospora zingiberis]|uniref:Polyhydroxybutyrate depolymerase n=1 Tax=Micromonospora zingiberis TaxID=2053011 RepID=A0A4R0GLF4_9ACTN|nr:PHB depolymerase family esterase [Micromonospora zingiberis]TCB98310.1 polyhydroxybutyrate depolymerase [Micromonospora zingiberis]
MTLEHDGVSRRYRVHAPPGYVPTRPVPLVIALHPYPGDGLAMSGLFGWDELAERKGFLVAYPDGISGGFNALVCCGDADDVGFLAALTGHLVDGWQVDPDRVYLTGISNGGDLSFRAAVEASGTFAAIGVVSGGFIGERAAAGDYAPRHPVSVITFIGEQDRYAAQFRTGVDRWQQRLACTPVNPPPAAPAEGATLTRARCADRSDVEVYLIDNMGHAWPGASGDRLGAPEVDLRATDLIWAFFADHPRLS